MNKATGTRNKNFNMKAHIKIKDLIQKHEARTKLNISDSKLDCSLSVCVNNKYVNVFVLFF